MKNLLFILSILFSFAASSQIATKVIGTDSVTGLKKQISVYQLSIDDVTKTVVIFYKIELLAPNGVIAHSSNTMSYKRYNNPGVKDSKGKVIKAADMRYDALEGGPLGKGIMQSIANDLNLYPHIDQP